MARLLIHVEGPTEEMFVKEVLKGYLTGRGYSDISPRILGKARLRGRRGGIVGWPTARKDILGHLKEDLTCIATTMVDYYGLPQTEDNGWPGRKKSANRRTRVAERCRSGNGQALQPEAIRALRSDARVRTPAVQRLYCSRPSRLSPRAGIGFPKHPERICYTGRNRRSRSTIGANLGAAPRKV